MMGVLAVLMLMALQAGVEGTCLCVVYGIASLLSSSDGAVNST